jgi:hypothetical protein
MSERTIDFPTVDASEEPKLTELIGAIADHLHTNVAIETVTSLRVRYDGGCTDLEVILKQLAGDPAGIKVKRVYKNNKNKSLDLPGSKPFRPSVDNLEKGLDPSGS